MKDKLINKLLDWLLTILFAFPILVIVLIGKILPGREKGTPNKN